MLAHGFKFLSIIVGEMEAGVTRAITVGMGDSSAFHLGGSGSRELIFPPPFPFPPFSFSLHFF